MKKMVSLLLVAVLSPVYASNLTQFQLDNGLVVMVKEDKRAPVVTSQVWYKVGASYEPDGVTGVSHMLEHMMFKGTENLKPGELSKIIARLGGSENAFTSQDYTAYFQTIHKDHLKR
ncbi:MAG: peptidase M16, partial [Thiotrichales bacterium 34-46-19]